MTLWSEVFLGIIALATLTVAVMLVGVLVAAGLLARRVNRLVAQIEDEIKPVFAYVNSIGHDAARATALATIQVERVDRLFADVARRVDETLNSLQATLRAPAGEGRALISGFLAAMRALRQGGRGRSRGEDEDTLFI